MELRKYQVDAIDAIEGALAFGADQIVLQAETSFGKSITAAGICQRFSDKHIVILVNIEPLIDQIAFFLKELKIDYSILKATRENEFNTHARVQLVMSQTYYARAESLKIKADIVIQDEIHKEFNTSRTKKLLQNLQPDSRIGMSATPWDQAGFALHNTDTISTVTCNELTEQGYLSPIDYFIPKWSEKLDYSTVSKSGNDYSMKALDTVIASAKHVENIVKAMNKMNAKNKKTLVFCSTIEQCDRIETALLADGYKAAAYHSQRSEEENKRIMKSFKYNIDYAGSDTELKAKNLFNEDVNHVHDGNVVQTLISVSKLTTGFSVDDIDLGVVVRPTKVKSLWHQIAGRVRRTYYGLSEILMSEDYCEDSKYAFILSVYFEVDEVKAQLKKNDITNVDLFKFGKNVDELKDYDEIHMDVRPDKKSGQILDLGQCVSLHGFPEDTYNPPEKSFMSEKNKELIEEATKHLRMEHLAITLDSDTPEIITRDKYELKIAEIKANKKKLSNMTTKELSAKMELEEDPVMIVAILAVLFDKIHCVDMTNQFGQPSRGYRAKNGKDAVNFVNGDSIGWMSELWVEKLPQQEPYYQRKYLKAMRTRSKNMLREKASIWGIRFFINWLIEQDEVTEEPVKEEEQVTTGYEVVYEEIDEDDIPF